MRKHNNEDRLFPVAPAHSKLPPMMPLNPPINTSVDCAAKVKGLGAFAVVANGFTLFAVLMFDYQSGGHGEMGSFYHENMLWILLFTGWGLATGVGLLRAWRWARISTLIFSGLLAALGILAAVAFLRTPGSDLSGWQLLLSMAVVTLLFLSPTAVGIWLLRLFTRKEVKAYFQAVR
jgi:hypothetical protein